MSASDARNWSWSWLLEVNQQVAAAVITTKFSYSINKSLQVLSQRYCVYIYVYGKNPTLCSNFVEENGVQQLPTAQTRKWGTNVKRSKDPTVTTENQQFKIQSIHYFHSPCETFISCNETVCYSVRHHLLPHGSWSVSEFGPCFEVHPQQCLVAEAVAKSKSSLHPHCRLFFVYCQGLSVLVGSIRYSGKIQSKWKSVCHEQMNTHSIVSAHHAAVRASLSHQGTPCDAANGLGVHTQHRTEEDWNRALE